MNQRNPIIEIPYEDTVYRIQIIGDPHFGKTFKTGVPTSKIGIREENQLNTFKELLNTSDIDHFIIMGDLFDKFVVNNEILIKVYNLLKETFTDKKSQCHIIAGNHDLSKNKDKTSSFEILAKLFESTFEKVPVNFYLKSDLFLIHNTDIVFYFDAYNPYYQDVDLNNQFLDKFNMDTLEGYRLYSFGHWDDPRFNQGYLPFSFLLDYSELIVSGHYHIPDKFEIGKTTFIYSGSMQPYSHGEDPNNELYITYDYKDLENIFTELDGFNELKYQNTIDNFKNKNIRINCYPGYIFPYSIEFQSLIYNNVLVKEDEEVEIQSDTINDFSTLYLLTLKNEYNIDENLLFNIDQFLKGNTDNLGI